MNRILFVNLILVAGLGIVTLLVYYSTPERVRNRIQTEVAKRFDFNSNDTQDGQRKLAPDSITISKRNESYRKLLADLTNKRKQWALEYEVANDRERIKILDQAEKLLFNALTQNNGLLDHWVGTPWEFSGISEQPLVDSIACGYFVSTPLKHCGFNLNRYRLAQQYSHSIVKSLCPSSQIKTYNKLEEVFTFAKQLPDALYIVGLDNHVGFLANMEGSLYFIHSNYLSPGTVVREDADVSDALDSSELYVIGRMLGDNHQLIKKWLIGQNITIVP